VKNLDKLIMTTIKSISLNVNREEWQTEDVIAYFDRNSLGELYCEVWIDANYNNGSSLTQEDLPFEGDPHSLYFDETDRNYIALFKNDALKIITRHPVESKTIVQCQLIS